MIAEKIRAILQQIKRRRWRRQDIYDLFLLIRKFPNLSTEGTRKILDSLRLKSNARNIRPVQSSFRDDEIKMRAKRDYQLLAHEVAGQLPDFDTAYNTVSEFYEGLPW